MAAVGHRVCDQRRRSRSSAACSRCTRPRSAPSSSCIALIATFLDAAGITPTTRRLLGRRASQNVVSFGEREMPGALVLVAHYDSGPTRTWPLRPMFIAMVILLACCVARVGGMSGVALTVVQFLATVVLIVYVALMLDIALSPTSQGESDNASGVGVVLRLAERLTDLNYFGVHVVFTGAQKARAQGMRAFLQTHRKQFAPSEHDRHQHRRASAAASSGRRRRRARSSPSSSHPQLTGNLDSDPFVNREAERRLRRRVRRPPVRDLRRHHRPARGGQPRGGRGGVRAADRGDRRGAQLARYRRTRRPSRAPRGSRASRATPRSPGAAPAGSSSPAPRASCSRACAAPPGSARSRSGTCRGEQYSRTRRRISATTSSVSWSRTTTNRIISSSTSTTRLSSTSSTPSTAL